MIMNPSYAVAAAVLLAGASAQAQPTDTSLPQPIPISPSDIHGGDFLRSRYGPRLDDTVYAVGWQSRTGGGVIGPPTAATVYDDVTFGGNCSNSLPISLNGIAIGLWEPASATDFHIYLRLSFFPNHDSAAAPTAPPFSGTPVTAVLDLGNWSGCLGCGEALSDPATLDHTFATLDASNVFDAGAADRTCGVLEEIYSDPALTVRRNGWGMMIRANMTSQDVGSSDPNVWFNASNPNTGIILNSSPYFVPGIATNPRAVYLAFQATGCSTPPGPCCRADYDGDGDIGTDHDIESFFACLSGDCCPTCPPNADFNCDGDSGTDQDIESFFRVLAGGPC